MNGDADAAWWRRCCATERPGVEWVPATAPLREAAEELFVVCLVQSCRQSVGQSPVSEWRRRWRSLWWRTRVECYWILGLGLCSLKGFLHIWEPVRQGICSLCFSVEVGGVGGEKGEVAFVGGSEAFGGDSCHRLQPVALPNSTDCLISVVTGERTTDRERVAITRKASFDLFANHPTLTQSSSPKMAAKRIHECLDEAAALRLGNNGSNDPSLDPKHKIFLSHSGSQKEFVEHLCVALESRCRYPFFDKRPSSLPKGQKFAELIFEAVKQCKILVVVISDEYFMSKWPMMELHAFVQEAEAIKDRPGIPRKKNVLPLFYGLSVDEFKDKSRREKWFERWETLAKDDGERRIDVNAWKEALRVLGGYNGISYNRKLREIKGYEGQIVSHICREISADVKWDDSHVQGKSQICEVLLEKIQRVGRVERYRCKLVGVFGVGGMGKTTVCKTLCNQLSNKYEGRVCHVELETKAMASSTVESLRKVVILLTDMNSEFVQDLDEGRCRDILRNSASSPRTFLVVDNVGDNYGSITQAKTILEAPKFHEESVVIVTARSRSTLEMLGIRGEACVEMPGLGEADAAKLFLYHAAGGKQFAGEEKRCDILQCIRRCHFYRSGGTRFQYHPLALQALGVQLGCVGKTPSEWVKMLSRVRNFSYLGGGNPAFDILRSNFDIVRCITRSYFNTSGGTGFQYHPLALEALGVQLGCVGETPSEWVKMLPRVRNFSYLGGGNPVFDILRSNFDMLRASEQSLFLDLLVYRPFDFSDCGFGPEWGNMVEWLCMVYRVGEDEIKSRVDGLKRKGLLQNVDWTNRDISVHDLYMEFAVLEAEGKLDDSTDFERRGCMYITNGDLTELERRPSGGCWPKLSRLGIKGSENRIGSLEGIEWQWYSNVMVLVLARFTCFGGPLNLEGLKCLRSLQCFEVKGLDRVEGLEGLRNLKFFKWGNCGTLNCQTSVVGQLPASLQVLEVADALERVVSLEPDVLVRCRNLFKLKLCSIQAPTLDLSSCSSLQTVSCYDVQKLQTLSLTRTGTGACSLKSLEIESCCDLADIPGLDERISLERLVVLNCRSLHALPNLQNLTKLQHLQLVSEAYLERKVGVEVAGCCPPPQLRELYYRCSESDEAPNVSGYEQLEVLELDLGLGTGGMATSLEGLEDLPALRRVVLSGWRVCSGWPDLSRSKKLKVIELYNCDMELQEEDIRIIASLPLLQPVQIDFYGSVKWDLAQRKLLRHRYMSGHYIWEESDRGKSLIKLIIEKLEVSVEMCCSKCFDNVEEVAYTTPGVSEVSIDRWKSLLTFTEIPIGIVDRKKFVKRLKKATHDKKAEVLPPRAPAVRVH